MMVAARSLLHDLSLIVSKDSGCVDHTGTATNKFTHFRILFISGSWAYSIYHYCHKINCQIWFPITIFTSSPPSRGCGISRPPSRRHCSRKALMAQRWNHSLHFFAAGDTAKNLIHLLVYHIIYIYALTRFLTFYTLHNLVKERGVHCICAPKTALSITQLSQNKRLVKSGWKKGSHRIHLLPGRHHGYVLYMFGFQPSDLSAGV